MSGIEPVERRDPVGTFDKSGHRFCPAYFPSDVARADVLLIDALKAGVGRRTVVVGKFDECLQGTLMLSPWDPAVQRSSSGVFTSRLSAGSRPLQPAMLSPSLL